MQRGYDGAKRLSGRKRFVICDTLGLWLEVVVLPASVPERKGAEEAFWRLAGQEVCAALEVVWADAGFEGKEWQHKIEEKFGLAIELVKRCDGMQGFEVLPKRWIVERYRRALFWLDELLQASLQRLRRPHPPQPRLATLGHD